MPTGTDFLVAAERLDSAAVQVGELMTAAENANAASVLRGGLLGTQVPQRIAESAQRAALCRTVIEQAAETCRDRATVIELYEAELTVYDVLFAEYEEDHLDWRTTYDAYVLDSTGMALRPGPQPTPPDPPTPPPEWADVRRP